MNFNRKANTLYECVFTSESPIQVASMITTTDEAKLWLGCSLAGICVNINTPEAMDQKWKLKGRFQKRNPNPSPCTDHPYLFCSQAPIMKRSSV